MAKKKPLITKHILMPKHRKLSEKEKEAVLNKYLISPTELPKILREDPAVANLDLKVGDVIEIVRKSATAKEAVFYRVVVDV